MLNLEYQRGSLPIIGSDNEKWSYIMQLALELIRFLKAWDIYLVENPSYRFLFNYVITST